ncbi:hypothetical protein GH714_028697 [Hevea brasiliensis]|uniref:FAS1 domain-containing protein n=1 Tax=Hevea brasiliensis TaxID=3981 RepID=A0A6A6M4K4_HEVBR|nr:hypothetical protein GH714_028697 [Hevea brasiliensis]
MELVWDSVTNQISSGTIKLFLPTNQTSSGRTKLLPQTNQASSGRAKFEGLARSEFNFVSYPLYEAPNLEIPHRPRPILGDRDIFCYPSESDPPKVMIDIDKISKALWKAGYKNMSSIIEKQLASIVPFNEHELDRIILYKNNSITIFAPPDEALGMENSMDLRYQVAISKVQKEDCDTSDGYDVRTLYNYGRSLLMIRLVPERGYPSVNGEQITKWNIYNDGRVLVHGVEDRF